VFSNKVRKGYGVQMSLVEKVIRFTNDIVSSEYGYEIICLDLEGSYRLYTEFVGYKGISNGDIFVCTMKVLCFFLKKKNLYQEVPIGLLYVIFPEN
jgi:hypothetical protein